MRGKKVWAQIAGVQDAIIESVEFVGDLSFYDEEEDCDGPCVLVSVRIKAKNASRCPHCGRKCPFYDQGDGPRRWRALDLGIIRCFVEGAAPRVTCPRHGVVVAQVPWARHKARHTRDFEDQTAWLAAHTDRTTVSNLMRIAWRTVGGIVARVEEEAEIVEDRFQNLRRIGIDEISYRKGHYYITVVVDHDSGRLLWADEGRDEATLQKFFDLIGPERSAAIELVSADAAEWIKNAVEKNCPRATLCMDPFHVVKWATEALDEVRRSIWNAARKSGKRILAKVFKDARFALWKNPDNLTEKQEQRLSEIAKTSKPVYRAYLLKEALRSVFAISGKEGAKLLDEWLSWASRSKLKPFVNLARKIRKKHLPRIRAVLNYGLSNARVESMNGKLRLLHRLAFGFHSSKPFIALGMLKLGGLCPLLPGRLE